jgi:hypothetical protein
MWHVEIMNQETIFIRLLNEGTDVWRPAVATKIDENVYRIEMPDNYDPEDEEWEFKPNSIVCCETKILTDKKCLIAMNALEE